MSGTRYPAVKVFFAFLLCPLFAGLAAVPFMLLKMLIEVFTNPRLIGEVRGLEVFSLFFSMPILAQIIFFIPALVLALVITFLKVRGSRSAYLRISLASAVVAGLWTVWVFFAVISNLDSYRMVETLMPGLLGFLFGGVSMGLAAFWFLPKAPVECVEPANT